MTDPSPHPETVDGLDVNEAEDGLVVYDQTTDTVHHLNKTAAVIFGLCDGSRDAAAIAAELAVLFDLDEPPLAETRTCLAELAEKRLIT